MEFTENNIKMLNQIQEVRAMSDKMMQRLEENADTDAKKQTVENIRLVVDAQQHIITNLCEFTIEMLDKLEELLEKTQK